MKTALTTGAWSGSGEATARRLDRDGWRLLLVARRVDRLDALATTLRDAHALPLDLTAPDAPATAAAAVDDRFGGLDLLVNNAGSAWRAAFGDPDGGYENVRRTMELNFDAVLRLTEALLPVLRRSAPSAVVNVGSVSGRVALPRGGAYSASKFALAGWSEALHLEEREHGVHVGLVQPGFVATEGFPQSDLTARAATRWMVSTPERVAEAVVDAGPGGKAERWVPRPYAAVWPLRVAAPALWRRVGGSMHRETLGPE
jgi:short-subunit dehydrogenase